jgi:hypothetical protein
VLGAVNATHPLPLTLELADGRTIATIADASALFSTLTPAQKETSHWRIAVRMLSHAVREPAYLRAATLSLQTALVLDYNLNAARSTQPD